MQKDKSKFFKFPSLSLLEKKSKFKAFTLAEILLSLSIIGIVAAIALPSLLGNVNERAFETQKKALYTRFSQSIPLLPSLNGYGELVGNLSNCADTNSCHSDSELKDTAAESFIRDGLSKVMKITNICDSEHLGDCGLPDKIIPIGSSTALNLSDIKLMSAFNSYMTYMTAFANNTNYLYEQLDTKAAAFETVNGESILVYYNPNCEPDLGEFNAPSESNAEKGHYVQPKLCANFVYDLNGKKGPNTVGKDIGFITALYSTDPSIVAPTPYSNNIRGNFSYDEANTKCRELGSDYKLPSVDELASLFFNKNLIDLPRTHFWSNTHDMLDRVWRISSTSGRKILYEKDDANYGSVRCVKR